MSTYPQPTKWSLNTRRIGRRVLQYACVSSTNTLAATLASDPANDGLVILADVQSGGRGQHGRSWVCQPSQGVLLSVLLFPASSLRRPALLTAWAAVAVCETILRATGLQARIKWPNDILIRGKKVCGILIEQGQATVAGIGLNVRQSAEELLQTGLRDATSLQIASGREYASLDMARLLIEQLDADYECLVQGDTVTLEACWKWRLGMLGRSVIAECHDGNHTGRLLELGFSGVDLQQPDGTVVRLCPEQVRQLRGAEHSTKQLDGIADECS